MGKRKRSESSHMNDYIKQFMEDGREYQRPYGPEYDRSEYKKQESFETLLKWAVERKRGKVSYAKRILTDGYKYYSYSQQVKIVKAFLFLSLGDRRFAYKKVSALWDESFIDIVTQAWNEFHDEECGWLITRFFPKDFLAENLEALSTPYNYYFLCKRLGQEVWFVPAKEKFNRTITIAQYLEAISMTKHPIAKDEAIELLYRMASVAIYAHLANNEQMESKWGEIKVDETGHDMTMSYWFRCPEFLIYKNDNFKEVMVYLCLMGLENVVKDFCAWCDNIKARFSEIVGPLVPTNQDVTGESFLSAIIKSFPDKYRYMLDYESFQCNTWLNRRWRVMLNPHKRTRYGGEVQMSLVSIDRIPPIDLADINPSFHPYRKTEEDELSEEARNELIKDMLNRNPNLWTFLYTFDAIDSSMIPKEILDARKDVPF